MRCIRLSTVIILSQLCPDLPDVVAISILASWWHMQPVLASPYHNIRIVGVVYIIAVIKNDRCVWL